MTQQNFLIVIYGKCFNKQREKPNKYSDNISYKFVSELPDQAFECMEYYKCPDETDKFLAVLERCTDIYHLKNQLEVDIGRLKKEKEKIWKGNRFFYFPTYSYLITYSKKLQILVQKISSIIDHYKRIAELGYEIVGDGEKRKGQLEKDLEKYRSELVEVMHLIERKKAMLSIASFVAGIIAGALTIVSILLFIF